MTYFESNIMDGCQKRSRIGGSAELRSQGNIYRNNGLRGAAVFDSARVSFENDSFESNRGEFGAEPYYGGLAVAGAAEVDAGGRSLTLDGQARSSSGNNRILGNRSLSDPALDLSNATSRTVKAENDWWGDGDPSDQISGPVDFTPVLTEPPQWSGHDSGGS